MSLSPRAIPKRRSGVTLVELLVVVGVVAILVVLLLPAVQLAREAARKTQCQNHIRQIGIAVRAHESVNGVLPAGWSADSAEQTGWGWATMILPYLEQQYVPAAASQTDDGAPGAGRDGGTRRRGPPPWAGGPPIEDPLNAQFRETPIAVYLCPSDPSPQVFMLRARGATGSGAQVAEAPEDTREVGGGPPMFRVARANYAGVFGTSAIESSPSSGDGVFYHNSRIRSANIRDGLSNTVFVGERSSRLGGTTWVGSVSGARKSMARVVGRTGQVPNDVLGYFEDFSSHHVAGAGFLFGDGAVRVLSDAIDVRVYRALATRSGGEVVDASSFVGRRAGQPAMIAVVTPADH
jgi:type II secretory pathway pseudopilin PulG